MELLWNEGLRLRSAENCASAQIVLAVRLDNLMEDETHHYGYCVIPYAM